MRKVYFIVAIISAVVIAAIIYGFSIIGSPFKKAALKNDQTRILNLNSLSWDIENYATENKKLPEKLSDVSFTNSNYLNDPKTKKPYTYVKESDTEYKLCATFELDSSEETQTDTQYYYYTPTEATLAQFKVPTDTYSDPKTHKKSYDCIEYDITNYSSSFNLNYDKISISSPTTNTDFQQGGFNQISWTGDYVSKVDIVLINSNNEKIGYISSPEIATMLDVQDYSYFSWSAATVFVDNTGGTYIPIQPGKYKIQINSTVGKSTATSSEFIVSPQEEYFSLFAPSENYKMKQASDNYIVWSKKTISQINISLWDSDRKNVIGYISAGSQYTSTDNRTNLIWKADKISATLGGAATVPVSPGKYTLFVLDLTGQGVGSAPFTIVK